MQGQENKVAVDQILFLVQETPLSRLVTELREYAREQLTSGYSSAQLYVDLMGAYSSISTREDQEEQEDALLDVMDFLTGWCSPDSRLY